ncbi:hypothetical protein E2C01_011088 [Portunus trituberculatus]|uniref:Uncharacterized protein n=1 Tax=Portunus trituberculatus TaxID=210409 RepID=A0A5B7DA62_PORTR|nr:hypothetical protein [Portunus trituberculatus]
MPAANGGLASRLQATLTPLHLYVCASPRRNYLFVLRRSSLYTHALSHAGYLLVTDGYVAISWTVITKP